MPKVAIVTTTIYVPKALENYLANALRHGHRDVFFVVTGDKKTPAEAKSFCAELSSRFPYQVYFLDVEQQLEYLKQFPELGENLPWNCIQRRNISFLYAYEQGADVIITMDDDNFIINSDMVDYIGAHLRVCHPQTTKVISTNSGWFNVCDFLTEERNIPFYHRGYPMSERWKQPQYQVTESSAGDVRVAVSAGMWLGDPDIDAMARLCLMLNATSYTRPDSYVLAADTWSPFNSQNTAVLRDVIPAYFMSWCVGRYDDIWPSYVVRRIADHLNQAVSYGLPVVHQERNPHNYFTDFDNERMGMQLTDKFCALLRKAVLKGTTYAACFEEVREAIEAALPTDLFTEPQRTFLAGFCKSMIVWRETMRRADERIRTGAV